MVSIDDFKRRLYGRRLDTSEYQKTGEDSSYSFDLGSKVSKIKDSLFKQNKAAFIVAIVAVLALIIFSLILFVSKDGNVAGQAISSSDLSISGTGGISPTTGTIDSGTDLSGDIGTGTTDDLVDAGGPSGTEIIDTGTSDSTTGITPIDDSGTSSDVITPIDSTTDSGSSDSGSTSGGASIDIPSGSSGSASIFDDTTDSTTDTDSDLIPDEIDNCVDVFNTDQMDFDMDGIGDECDDDDDNDGVIDIYDVEPYDPLIGSDPELDLDGDGIIDEADACVGYGELGEVYRRGSNAGCPLGDINADGVVDSSDLGDFLLIVSINYYRHVATNPVDINGDRYVDFSDVVEFVKIYNG